MEEGDEREWLDCRWVLKGDSESGESESRASLWYCKKKGEKRKRERKKEQKTKKQLNKKSTQKNEHKIGLSMWMREPSRGRDALPK